MGCGQSKKETTRQPSGGARPRAKDANNNDNGVGDDANIPPFVPDGALFAFYKAEIAEGKRRFHAPNPAVDNDVLQQSSSTTFGRSKRPSVKITDGEEVKPDVLTLYHVSPLPRVIARGQYSEVSLADMTVRTTTTEALVNGGSKSKGGASKKGMHTTGETETTPKYLIACKEYTIAGDNAPFVFNRLRDEVRRLTRLGFSSRLLKYLQMEGVYDDPRETGDLGVLPVALTHPSNTTSDSRRHILRKLSARSASNTPARTPGKVRIYMEYAKYGTLRNFLLNDIPSMFQKDRMHELTARAFMREVLVALAYLHENNVVHTDLCAKNIYLVGDMISEYTTCFPAYIADLPAGRLGTVPPERIRRVLALMDPASMHPQYGTEKLLVQLNDSVISNIGERKMGQNFPEEADALSAGVVAAGVDVKGDHNPPLVSTENEARPGAHFSGTVAAGATAAVGAGGGGVMRESSIIHNQEGDDGRCRWYDNEVQMYLHENAYDDRNTLPSPVSSEGPVNVFKSPDLVGLTIVRSGSFARSSMQPMGCLVLPPVLSATTTKTEFPSSAVVGNKHNADHDLAAPLTVGTSSSERGSLDAMLMSNTCKPGDECSIRATQRRHRKPLIKLGHYGRVRSILVDDPNSVHKLGRVSHLAPEVLQKGVFSQAADIYSFAMTFIELVSPSGGMFADLCPKRSSPPRTRNEKSDLDAEWLTNIKRFLRQNDNVVPIPSHLSSECKEMLRACLTYDPARRPSAVELLQTPYFLLGYWVTMATKEGRMEAPWQSTNYEAAAMASGLPRLPSEVILDETLKKKGGNVAKRKRVVRRAEE